MTVVEPSDVAHAYDGWASTYDEDVNPTRDLDAEVLRTSNLDVHGRDVVELGCGTGKNTTWLAMHARSVVALDVSAGMLARARARVPAAHVTFVQHDVRTSWPLADGTADVIVANLVLEHVEHLAPVYREAARVLRNGGELLFCELHPERQRRGGQAQFTDSATGETIMVPAHRHTVAEYVNDGLAAGLELLQLGEWIEDAAPPAAPPRLLSVRFRRPGGTRP